MTELESKSVSDKIRACLAELTEEERQLLGKVITAEREKLHMKQPRHINDDIWKAVTEVLK
jgi:ribosome recycling factor